jgi:hypothetical protein
MGDRAQEPLAVTGDPDGLDLPILRPAMVLGRYEILRWLGSGGMGVVYAAYDPELDRRVALKLVKPGRCRGDSVYAQTLVRREARIQARLSHPHVVTVFDVGSVGQQVFIAMEFVDGQDLRCWLRSQPRSTAEVLRVLLQAGEGLVAAHAAGLVHRDFKPDNVLVDAANSARVTDFGLAHPSVSLTPVTGDPAPAALEDSLLSRTGTVLGTPPYMAPEVRRGGKADERSDQYAYCVSLYESLYGRHPFQADSAEAMAALMQRGELGPLPDTPDRRDTAWVYAILKRGLSPDPDARFPSMAALLEALRRDPVQVRRRRARTAALLAALAMGLAGLAAAVLLWKDRPAACRGAQARLRDVWDEGRRQAVRTAFLGARTRRDEGAWGQLASGLDRYAEEWSRQHREVCEKTVRRELSTELGDLQMQCLEQRLLELQALTRLLATGDEAVLQKAEDAARALTSPDSCAALTLLTMPERPPSAAAARARIAEVRRQQAQINALRDTDRIQEALAQARSALAEAQEIGYRPLTAELMISVGHLLALSLGGGSETFREPERILRVAAHVAEAARHDQAEVDARTILVDILKAQNRLEEAEQMIYDARATVERMGGDERRAIGLDLGLAGIMRLTLRYREAMDLLTSAAERLERLDGPWSPGLVYVLSSQGHILIAQLRFRDAEAPIRRAMAIAERNLGPGHSESLEASMSLVASLTGQHRAREAWDLGQSTLAQVRRIHPADSIRDRIAGVMSAAGRRSAGARTGSPIPRAPTGADG